MIVEVTRTGLHLVVCQTCDWGDTHCSLSHALFCVTRIWLCVKLVTTSIVHAA